VVGNDTCGLLARLDAEDLKRLANALVDRMGRNSKLGRNFLRRQVLIDKSETIELAGAEARYPLSDDVVRGKIV
jgi:hypothetical protein